MHEPRSPLDFDLPPLPPEADSGGSNATPAQIVAWLDSASVADAGAAIKRLRDVARVMNRTTLPSAERVELSAMLDARTAPVIAAIDRQLQNLAPPLEGDDKARSQTLAELLDELAISQLRSSRRAPSSRRRRPPKSAGTCAGRWS